MKRSVSYTTRKPREVEENGKDYIFISEDEFKKKLENSEFVEWENNFGKYYGTSKEQIFQAEGEGFDIILSIDVRGAEKVREEFSDAISIFIMPPSFEELQRRLENRKTDSEEVIKTRLNEARREMDAAGAYDYLIVNDELEEAVNELIKIIEKERVNRKQQKG